MKKLNSKQVCRVKALNNKMKMDCFVNHVSDKAKERFNAPPYGGKKVK